MFEKSAPICPSTRYPKLRFTEEDRDNFFQKFHQTKCPVWFSAATKRFASIEGHFRFFSTMRLTEFFLNHFSNLSFLFDVFIKNYGIFGTLRLFFTSFIWSKSFHLIFRNLFGTMRLFFNAKM